MNKKTILSLLLCLALGASLFALPAFAEDTVIVIGGPLGQSQTENIAGQSTLNTVSAISNSGVVIFGSSGNAPVHSASSAGSVAGAGELNEALAALMVLGYRQEEVMPVLARLPEDAGAEELIRLTLREMGKKR